MTHEVPIITHGPKLGLHSINPGNTLALVQRAVDAGWHWPWVKMVNDASPLIDVKRISPKTITECRYINANPLWESLQDVGDWSLQRMEDFAHDCAGYILGRTPPNQLANTDYWNIENEGDPKGHYDAFGRALIELVKVADAHGLKLTLPALAQGTPEWDDMQRLVATGLFGYMKRGGHVWDCHEGCYRDQPIDLYYGDLIPGAPHVAGAGAYNFRHRYLYSLLEARNEVVPMVVSEFYKGGRYTDPPADQLAGFAWYDTRLRAEPYALAFLPFTINPDATWHDADYGPTYASAELWQYIASEKDKQNGEPDMPVTVSDADWATLTSIVSKYKPAIKHTMATRTNQTVIDLFHKTFNSYAELDALGGVQHLVDLGRSVGYVGKALEDTTLTAAQLAALIAAGA